MGLGRDGRDSQVTLGLAGAQLTWLIAACRRRAVPFAGGKPTTIATQILPNGESDFEIRHNTVFVWKRKASNRGA